MTLLCRFWILIWRQSTGDLIRKTVSCTWQINACWHLQAEVFRTSKICSYINGGEYQLMPGDFADGICFRKDGATRDIAGFSVVYREKSLGNRQLRELQRSIVLLEAVIKLFWIFVRSLQANGRGKQTEDISCVTVWISGNISVVSRGVFVLFRFDTVSFVRIECTLYVEAVSFVNPRSCGFTRVLVVFFVGLHRRQSDPL